MNQIDDTIAAISTATGEGGIGIVRISGGDAIIVADRIFLSPKGKRLQDIRTHSVVYGFIINPDTNEKVDEVLVTVMKAPATYTRENIVEINCHGGILPLRAILDLAIKHGARLAEPGEFTKRAFLNGRIDLSQAEAVIDIIRAKTDSAERIAFRQLEGKLSERITSIRDAIARLCAQIEAYIDFPEEDIETVSKEEIKDSIKSIEVDLKDLSNGYNEGRFFRDGIAAAIVGKPNVGKSSLLNALLQRDRAIVTELPGTTRDVIEDYLNINGLPLRIMDTAGIREAHDLAEIEGVRRSIKAIERADIVLAVLDASRSFDDADKEVIDKIEDKRAVIVINKSDIESPVFSFQPSAVSLHPVVKVSALKGDGIEDLKRIIYSHCISSSAEDILITNLRHKQSVDKAIDALLETQKALDKAEPLEVVSMFLRESLDFLGEIIGIFSTEDMLNMIFSEFCIGK